MGFILGLWKSKFEIANLKLDIQQKELVARTNSCEQMVRILARFHKVKAGTHDLLFSEDELRSFAGPFADRLHVALTNMAKEGTAQESKTPGEWRIS